MTERRAAGRRRRSRRGSEPGAAGDGSRAARRRAGFPVLLAAAAGALLLAFLVLRYSAVNALLQIGPDVAGALSPRHPAVLLERAFDELQLTGDPAEETEQAALAAFRRAPLSEVPLLIGAREAMAAGDTAQADRLIALASRRNPRSRYALLLRLDQHLRHGRSAEAAATMAVLTHAFPDAGRLLTVQLAAMAADPDTRAAVRRVMETDPQLRSELLEQLARQGADPATILSLAGSAPARGAAGPAPGWHRLLLEGMVERGEVGPALQVWLRLTGADPTARAGGIYDRDFAGLPGPPPFNWDLETTGDGFAERAGGGLQTEYYGRRDARLASQLLLLPPGRYRIGFAAEGRVEADGGHIGWVLSCHPGGRRLVEVPITGIDDSARPFAADFTVSDGGCPGQWLRLVGRAAEFPKDQRVTIRQLRIEGGGLR